MSYTNDVETEVLRAQTKSYIELAPTTVRLVPWAETVSAAGGHLRAAPGVPRKPQAFRIIPLDRRAPASSNLVSGRPADGVERSAVFEIMGEWDLEIERGDRFVESGVTYEVTEVQPSSSAPYLRRAFVSGIPDS